MENLDRWVWMREGGRGDFSPSPTLNKKVSVGHRYRRLFRGREGEEVGKNIWYSGTPLYKSEGGGALGKRLRARRAILRI